MPWREIRRKEQDRQLLTVAIGAWIFMAIAVFYGHLHVTQLIDDQNRRNQFLKQEIAKVEKEIQEIRELKKQRQALISRMNVIYQLQGDRTQIVHVFDDLVRKLPEGVYFSNMKQSGKNFTLQGVAQSNARVSALMRNLDSSEWFANPNLDIINVKEKSGDRVSTFKLQVQQASKASERKEEAPAQPAQRRRRGR
ncbi:MAG: pilus assembly protein PilN [Burkholderiales bacterium]|nr:pilus assembly protein PilN [Burkholderiales bacterium]